MENAFRATAIAQFLLPPVFRVYFLHGKTRFHLFLDWLFFTFDSFRFIIVCDGGGGRDNHGFLNAMNTRSNTIWTV